MLLNTDQHQQFQENYEVEYMVDLLQMIQSLQKVMRERPPC